MLNLEMYTRDKQKPYKKILRTKENVFVLHGEVETQPFFHVENVK